MEYAFTSRAGVRVSRACAFVCVILFVVGVSSSALGADADRARPDPIGLHPPVIFAHGVSVPVQFYETFIPLEKLFREHGYDLYIARTPLVGTLEARARILRDEINRFVPKGPYHIIGHSMGGLDGRLAIHKYGLGERCLSLTTLATPHHGSGVADYVIKHLGDRLVTVLMKLFGDDLGAARNLTSDYINNVFNVEVKDDPRVKYFSVGFFIPTPLQKHSLIPLFWASHGVVSDVEGHRDGGGNDGLVSVSSARWGEYLGTLPSDHWAETAPLPFFGGPSYREIFARVMRNIEKRFPAP